MISLLLLAEIISDAMAKLKLKITAEEEKSFPEIFVKESEACINPSSEFVEKMAVNGTDGFVSPRIPTSMIKLPKPHKKSFLVKLVQNTKFRVILTTLCGICVLFDLAEDILTSIPRLHSFTKRLKTRQGVFFLTLSSLISALSELIDRLDSRDEALEEDYAEKMAERYLSRSYALEEQAARAYDMAAIAIHGRQASLNFQYPTMDVDREGRLPEKYSEYRGVKWSNEDQAWLVDEAFL